VAYLVWRQLDLFPESVSSSVHPCRFNQVSDDERDRRSPGQWDRAIRAYLEWRSGNAWRRMSDPEQRNSPERPWYVDGLRTLNGIAILSRPVSLPKLEKLTEDVRVAKLARLPRAELVSRLMLANPSLTDRKLIAHFTLLKLARMLIAARDANAAALARTA